MSNEYNSIIAEGCIEAIDLIEQKKLSEFADIITDIIDAKLDRMAEDYDLSEDEKLDEAQKIVKKFNSKRQMRRKLVCGPGKKDVDGVCKVISASEKLSIRTARRKGVKTRRGKGKGAQNLANIKTDKAKSARSQAGA